jgi:hypothetical protein
LIGLTQYKRWLEIKPNLTEGDIVLIREDRTPRGLWRLGRIVSTYPGQDGLVRVAKVKTEKGIIK